MRKEKLSEYGFFVGNINELQPAQGVLPYDLNTPLFSNYAEKLRFIKLPEGAAAVYSDTAEFELPVGTYLIKNFYYPTDFRDETKGRRIIETRIMANTENGWQSWPYIWNDAQTDAVYDPAGETKTVTYINASGKSVTTPYLVPNKNQCKGCHIKSGNMLPIGIAARHLNKDYNYNGTNLNQLQHWAALGMLQGLPAHNVPANADYANQSQSIEQRARAYLDINCGHCHRATGPASTSGLFLDIQEANTTRLGIYKTPVAAGRGSGNLKYDIVPGKPDESILVYRMHATDPGIAMPELGREQIHKEGIAVIKEWIRQMK